MIIYVDIDETICTLDEHSDIKEKRDYSYAKPRPEQIAKINKLYDEGHEIVYWTARGTTTGIDWSDLTQSQLKNWNCQYTRIETQKKPYYNLFICDKSKRIEEL
jgi:phosphatidate phosphatase PAH1